jgi:ABC-type lipoprotein release transport system permease subunit
MTALLYGVRPQDPITIASATAVLLGVVLLATLLPARKAARISPVEALRAE